MRLLWLLTVDAVVRYTYPTYSTCPKTPPRHGYHWRDQTIQIWDQTQCLLRRVPTHVTEHSHWFRGRDSLDRTHSTVRCPRNARCGRQVRRWCGTAGAKETPQHIPLPPHELGLTVICANSIVHSPNGHFANVARTYTALVWRNKAFEYSRAGREVEIKALEL